MTKYKSAFKFTPAVVFIALAIGGLWFLFIAPKTAVKWFEPEACEVCSGPDIYAGLTRAFADDPQRTSVIGNAYLLALAFYQDGYFLSSYELLTVLSQQGHIDSSILLAAHYRRGAGVVADLNRTVELYQSAADQGRLNAAHALADLLMVGGEDLLADPVRAKSLYQLAAQGGYQPAIDKLQEMEAASVVNPDAETAE